MTAPGTAMASPTVAPDDEGFWSGIRAQYAVSDEFINLENGFFGIPALPVQQAHEAHNRMVNREGARFMRTQYPQRLRQVVRTLARFAGAGEDEVLIVRNPTEAMNILIQGYPFRPDDEVIACDQDYDSVNEALAMLEQRGRLRLVRVQLPFLPERDDEIIARYEAAITPRTRAIVLTHMLHRTGHLLPVAKIAALAQARGIDVMVDAAHSFGQVDYRLPELGAPFVAAHLHKWIGAPLGLGLLYIRRDRVADIAPLLGDVGFPPGDIRKLGHFGTTPAGAEMAIEDAIAFHERIGGRNKEARLRWLKDYWTQRVREYSRIRLLTPAAPERSCAIASFRVEGMDAPQVAAHLYDEHRIFTAATKVAGIDVVRVTPHLHTGPEQLDRLVTALKKFD